MFGVGLVALARCLFIFPSDLLVLRFPDHYVSVWPFVPLSIKRAKACFEEKGRHTTTRPKIFGASISHEECKILPLTRQLIQWRTSPSLSYALQRCNAEKQYGAQRAM